MNVVADLKFNDRPDVWIGMSCSSCEDEGCTSPKLLYS